MSDPPAAAAVPRGGLSDQPGAVVIGDIAVRRTPVEPSPRDLETLARQLGRPARGVVQIAARCACGRPVVARTSPRLANGEPFPTQYYLTHPKAASAMGTLEARGTMAQMNLRLAACPPLAAAHRAAHRDYLARRAELGEVPEIAGVSAGGMPDRVKCLHALAAHALAAGPGVNPLGDLALVLAAPLWRPDRCACAPDA
ncbi:MAG: DUF501 domain-containing protein [Bifidobacteriaceae bacterium]|nr:DUF501 domain-containing protein [Bifidobacteriaceae bacterium]